MTINIEQVWSGEPAAQMVAKFNTAMGFELPNTPMDASAIGTPDEVLCAKLITEEHNEFQEARAAGNLLDIIDALQDLKYVVYGYELRLGIASEEHFAEVHSANMRKFGPDGKPIYREDGKIMKPEGWTGPDHQKVLDNIGSYLYF